MAEGAPKGGFLGSQVFHAPERQAEQPHHAGAPLWLRRPRHRARRGGMSRCSRREKEGEARFLRDV